LVTDKLIDEENIDIIKMFDAYLSRDAINTATSTGIDTQGVRINFEQPENDFY
jgi:hypothetical protein